MKEFRLYILISFLLGSQLYSQCNNIDFEDGTTNTWVTTGDALVMGVGVDPYGLFPVSAPGGAFSLRLGNDFNQTPARSLSTATRTFAVTAANPFITYSYAMVLLDFLHAPAVAATVTVEVLDNLGDVIPCTRYQAFAAPGGPGGFLPGVIQGRQFGGGMFPVSYLPWTRATIDLTAFIGTNVTLRMSNEWCTPNVDWGYCYIDAECVSDISLVEVPNCEANETTITAPADFVAYNWVGPGIIAGGNTNTVTVNQTGVYTVTLTTNTGCLIDVSTNILALPEYQTAGFIFSAGTCLPNLATPVQFTDESTLYSFGVTTYSYDFGDGGPIDNSPNPSHVYGAAGDYDVTLTITHSDGCVDDITKRVSVSITPDADFTATTVCNGNNTVFNDITVVNAPDFITGWSWDFGDGSPLDITPNPNYLYGNDGTYNVSLTITTDLGCNNTFTLPVEVYPLPVISFTADSVCENTPPTVFVNTSSVSSGNIAVWNWDLGDGSNSILQNPTHIYGVYGDYAIALTATTDNGCVATSFNNIYVKPVPVSLFDALEQASCLELCTDFSSLAVTPAGTITSWDWDFGNGTTSSLENPEGCFENLSNTQAQLFDVTLTVQNSFGCVNTLAQNDFIEIYPKPLAQFDVTPEETSFLAPEVATTNQSIGNDINLWSDGDGNNYVSTDFTYIYPDTGSYVVTLDVENLFGCVDFAQKTVRILPENLLFVPNTFTPDGDGKNDKFAPVFFDVIEKDYKFYIFNKDGDLIFQTDLLSKGWNGTEKGKASKTDTYVWRIQYRDSKNKKYERIGHVNLLR